VISETKAACAEDGSSAVGGWPSRLAYTGMRHTSAECALLAHLSLPRALRVAALECCKKGGDCPFRAVRWWGSGVAPLGRWRRGHNCPWRC